MKILSSLVTAFLFGTCSVSIGQSGTVDHLSANEIQAAIEAQPDTGFVFIEDAGFSTPSQCQAQMPSESIFTPSGWINAMSRNAKKQYSRYVPSEIDSERVLTVLSKGCANGSQAGPVCETITRVVLLSDKAGTVTAEAVSENPLLQAWQNGYGASASCSSLVSRFSMADVQRVRNGKSEFLIATFDGTRLLKIYTVKEKYIRKLGL
jgi:hypothetical protein